MQLIIELSTCKTHILSIVIDRLGPASNLFFEILHNFDNTTRLSNAPNTYIVLFAGTYSNSARRMQYDKRLRASVFVKRMLHYFFF